MTGAAAPLAAPAACPTARSRNGWVTRYSCDIGTTGIRTPAIRPISAAYIPPAFTTTSHSIRPRSVATAANAPAVESRCR